MKEDWLFPFLSDCGPQGWVAQGHHLRKRPFFPGFICFQSDCCSKSSLKTILIEASRDPVRTADLFVVWTQAWACCISFMAMGVCVYVFSWDISDTSIIIICSLWKCFVSLGITAVLHPFTLLSIFYLRATYEFPPLKGEIPWGKGLYLIHLVSSTAFCLVPCT